MEFKKDSFRDIRKSQRWTVQALADKLNTSSTTIHMWESGHHEPPVKKIYEAAKLFNVPVKDLMVIPSDYKKTNEKSDSEKDEPVRLIDSLRGADIDQSVGRLNSEVDFLEKKVKELSLLVNTLLQITPVPFYIKDSYQQYVIGNKAFYEILDLPENFALAGKKDEEIFSESEAKSNTKEDAAVIHTREAVRNREGFIPGTRKKKWGDIHKLPVMGTKNYLLGIMGVFADITKRKQEEDLRIKLEKMLNSTDETIWMGRGLKKDGERVFIEEIIFISSDATRRGILRDKISLDYEEQIKYYQSLIVDEPERKRHDLSRIKDGEHSEVYYKVKVEHLDYPLQVRERIYYNADEDLFIGVIYAENSPFTHKKLT
ncbi:MAG: helix-turn-helix domain-containing protein [Lentisphaerota bacterium]